MPRHPEEGTEPPVGGPEKQFEKGKHPLKTGWMSKKGQTNIFSVKKVG